MKRVRLAVIIIVAVAVIGTGIWWLIDSSSPDTSSDISTSGFIEAIGISISPEIGGRITAIAAEEGDRIEAGTVLVRLDDSLLSAQAKQAETAVEIARAALGQAQASLNQTRISAEGAKKILDNALDIRENPLELEARIIVAGGEVKIAEENYEYLKGQSLVDASQLEIARLRREVARQALDNLLAIRENPQEINAAVSQADTAYQSALQAVETAGKAVEIAGLQIEQAEASLNIIEIQIDKLELVSPLSGTVSARYYEEGEIARAGSPVLTVTVLDEVTITVYVPESKLGRVKLGQEAVVSIDSYPDETFSGEVVYISPEAQFTPRNIQLQEEREKTVYAVKIRLDNPEGKMKPGMPADAEILTEAE